MEKRYEILEALGSGGFSKVYRCYDNNTGSYRCMKVFGDEIEMARKEAAYLAKVNHRCFPFIVDFVEESSHCAIVMEYIEGVSMAQIIDARTRIFDDIVVRWMAVVSEALHYLHSFQNPIVHGDVKPDNIIIDSYGEPRIIDFSSAIVWGGNSAPHGPVYGTPGFASPEQMLSLGTLSKSVDIFGFGITFDRLIKNCSMGNSIDLKAITKKCTEVNPDSRFKGFSEIIAKL